MLFGCQCEYMHLPIIRVYKRQYRDNIEGYSSTNVERVPRSLADALRLLTAPNTNHNTNPFLIYEARSRSALPNSTSTHPLLALPSNSPGPLYHLLSEYTTNVAQTHAAVTGIPLIIINQNPLWRFILNCGLHPFKKASKEFQK